MYYAMGTGRLAKTVMAPFATDFLRLPCNATGRVVDYEQQV